MESIYYEVTMNKTEQRFGGSDEVKFLGSTIKCRL